MKSRFIEVPKSGWVEGSARCFKFIERGVERSGFVILKGGRFFAYENLCRHLPVPLDFEDGNFFSHDKKFLQCQMHGAIYDIETGECIGGPCVGAFLRSFKVREEKSRVLVQLEV